MTLTETQDNALADLRNVCAFPLVLDTCNNSEVIVKDSRGDIIFHDDFGSIPDHWSTWEAALIRHRGKTIGALLVALSEGQESHGIRH